LVLVASAAGYTYASFASRQGSVDLRNHAWRILVVAIAAARLGFVWNYRQAYAETPLELLNIRDGGWDPQTGIIAAWGYTLVLIGKHPNIRKPLLATVGISTGIWFVGMVAALWMPHEETKMPPLALSSFDGTTKQLLSFEGKPTVVNLWATWCPPCQREMPVLQAGQKDNPDVHFVFLNQGESAEQVTAFLYKHQLNLKNVLLDPKGSSAAHFGVMAYPTTLFFDAGGHLVDQRLGELSKASLIQKLALIRASKATRTVQ
jgi:thiol-disulfide isomerase/thioredoxin